jgi:hypothetical protein
VIGFLRNIFSSRSLAVQKVGQKMSQSSAIYLYLKTDWQFYLIVVTSGPRRSYQVDELVKVERVDNFLRNVVHFEQEAPLSDFKIVGAKRPALALFRENIKPAWEDEHNRDGGGFSFEIPQNDASKACVNEIWRNMQLSAVSSNGLDSLPNMESTDDDSIERRSDPRPSDPLVNGVMVTLKPDGRSTRYVFEVWVSRTQIEPARKDHIMSKIPGCIRLSARFQALQAVKFQKHRTTR